jgi:ABC-type antimicrobial peptide transport system permease subunit
MVISLLAGYGVYSLNSYTLETRRRELAITVAMGASARQVVGSVLENAARNAALSFCAGVVLAFAAGGLFRHVLYGVAPLDPVSLAASAAALSIIGVGACVPPALRASRVDPASVLKEQ